MNSTFKRKFEFSGLPGSELVLKGLDNLASKIVSEETLLLQICAPRLRRLGIEFPIQEQPRPYEHRLYELLEDHHGKRAYSRYKSLLQRIVSFSQALEREAAKRR